MALHPEGVGGVVDDTQVVVVGNLLNGLDVTGMTVDVNGENGCRLGRDGCLDLGRVEVEGVRVNIDEDRFDAIPE